MEKKFDITASIVIFNEEKGILRNTIDCFLSISDFSRKIYLIDNTLNSDYKEFESCESLEYLPVKKNIGFGAAHNKIIDNIKNESKYHLILNPDVGFEYKIFNNLINVLEADRETMMIAPKILFPDRSFQNSCRRFPTIKELIARRVSFLQLFFKSTIKAGEYADKNLSEPFYADYLTGCFQLYKTEDFVKIKGFDERYFLYMEDVDICRKIDAAGKKKMYYPHEEIVHVLKKGSNKNIRLFFRHFASALKYFNKWGY
jgi:hypothetical protein